MNGSAERLIPLQKRIGYQFHDRNLLERALTHRSASPSHLERQEFLGDSVLGLVVSEQLYQRFPDDDEGSLSSKRAALVCRASLLKVANAWQLAEILNVGAGERDTKGRIRAESIIADAVEAVIAAVFLDGGWEAARKLVAGAWEQLFAKAGTIEVRDAKSRLQELTQEQGWGLPEYQIEDHGISASPRFASICYVQGKAVGKGEGVRKKEAERVAAEQALSYYETNE